MKCFEIVHNGGGHIDFAAWTDGRQLIKLGMTSFPVPEIQLGGKWKAANKFIGALRAENAG